MKLLVTGGAGFIGSHFIKYMLENYKSFKIVNLDLLTYAGNLETLKTIQDNENYTFIKGDITDEAFIDVLFEEKKFDIVVNFAAESHVDRSVTSPGVFIKTNVIGTQILLDAARKYKIAKYHQVSTDEVYGDLPLERLDLLFSEDTPLNPSSPYAASKAAADLLVLAYHRTYGMPITISRCSNNYGSYQFPEKLIPLIITRAIAGEHIPIYGDGLNIRDWLYVEDHCSAIDRILHRGKVGEVYNIGAHNEKANIEVAKFILKELGKKEALLTFIKDRPGHDQRYAIDSCKLQKQVGWMPRYPLDYGLKKTIKWYVEHESWWKSIISGEYMNYYNLQYEQHISK